ncbi:MAG TPA: ATP synthase F1 subunit delta, partial [Longimicrobiales bacterium]|nr:ATP synthase F1 subunit delta [Longimicrobiales bacterium]
PVRETTIARAYAEALFELAAKRGEQDAVMSAFEVLDTLLADAAEIRTFLETPKIAADDKKQVLRDGFEGRTPEIFTNFLQVVVDHGRQGVFHLMEREFRTLVDEHEGRLHVNVTLAREPDDAQRSEIAADLSRTLGKDVVPHIRVNRNIMGGIVVRFGDQVLDGSLKRRLSSLRRQMLDADLPKAAASAD